MIFFSSSEALRQYVRANDVTVWHGDYGMGTLLFIDSSTLHVVFSNRKEYEDWLLVEVPNNLLYFRRSLWFLNLCYQGR